MSGHGAVPDVGYGRQFAEFYDRMLPAGPASEQTARWLAGLHPGGVEPALELGVGTGRIALPLAALLPGGVVGVDSSPEMLDQLRQALHRTSRPVAAVHGDACTYRPDRRFPLVYCVCGTLSIVDTPVRQQEVLATCARAVAAGGVVVIETHNPAHVEALHDGRPQADVLVPYPGRDASLRAESMIDLPARRWSVTITWSEHGRSWTAQEQTRLTMPDEIDRYARRAGLRPAGRYGDWAGTPFRGDEPMVICQYRRDG
jgi:ubiquinone/menaquinone biosynthesis C-methylase UbiE